MTDQHHRNVLLLTEGIPKAGHLVSLLSRDGWTVVPEDDPESLLARLEQSVKQPFALFICDSAITVEPHRRLLKRVKTLSPMTRQMLLVSRKKPDVLIRVINTSGIDAFITRSFRDDEFLEQATTCLNQFKDILKERQLKRVIGHQNKKMVMIARKLKQKEETLNVRISEKKAERLMVRSRLRKRQRKIYADNAPTLASRLDSRGIEITPEALENEFTGLATFIRGLFNTVAQKLGLSGVERVVPDGGQIPETWDEFARDILKTALLSPDHPLDALPDAGTGGEAQDRAAPESIDQIVRVTIDKDRTTAYIEKIAEPLLPETLTPGSLLALLRDHGITYGIVEDDVLESWIETAKPGEEKRIAALGDPPVPGSHGKMVFHFEIDYTNPGKINEDGTIDFRERGDIPYVRDGELLAEKDPAAPGKPGTSISGEPVPVPEVDDPPFTAGPGTRTADDGLKIYAARNGQPHVDLRGTVTVNEELTIKGDVDFETGNINFNGNIFVLGTIKDGFTVRGVHLIAREIQGGIINVKGDICVSAGITDADIRAQGNVYAKYMNHSKVKTFGDVVIQRETIDSDILASGEFNTPSGQVMASVISAKSGIDAFHIGTESSSPVDLTVGRDDHAQLFYKEIDMRIEASVADLKRLREKIKETEEKDQVLVESITQKAQAQESAQNALNAFKKEVATREADLMTRQESLARIRELTGAARAAEGKLDGLFEIQDSYAGRIEALRAGVEKLEQDNKRQMQEKKVIREFSARRDPHARVIVRGRIIQGTDVRGPNTRLTLGENRSRCRITETAVNEDGLFFHDMRIAGL